MLARLTAGQSHDQIAQALNPLPSADWHTRSGKPWSANIVRRITA